jgi:hypothetical protein
MRVTLMTAVVLTIVLLASSPAHACSKGTFSTSLGDSQAFFTGQATADTLLTGPGAVSYGSGGGHYGRTDRRAIYGQVVRVDQLGGPATRLLPQGTREVVVVPWDYDAACQPLAWGRSAQWVPPGTRGFYIASLRAPEHWVAGKPTFDLHNPGHLPYTGTERIREMGRDTAVSTLLSPDQVFDFYQALPTADEVAKRKAEALGMLRRWVQAHPDLAQRPPAEMLLRFVLSSVAHAELKEVNHPVLGTWRFKLQVPGGSTHTFYARTEAYPTNRWTPSRTRVEPVPGQLQLAPAEGYTFLVAVSDALDDLPEAIRARDYKQAYIYALALPDSSGAEKAEWRGWLESSLLRQAFPDDPVIERAAKEAFERFSSRYRQGLPDETPARFTRGVDGVLRVQQSFPLSEGRDLLVEGEQVSRKVIQIPW